MKRMKKWYVLYRVNNIYKIMFVKATTEDAAYRKANRSDIVSLKICTNNKTLADKEWSKYYYDGR